MSFITPILLALGALVPSPCAAQIGVTSFEELRRQLAAGDVVTVVTASGSAIAGRLIRVGDGDLDIRPSPRKAQDRTPHITIPFNTLRSLERPPDSVRNGVSIGAGIGAAVGAAMFVTGVLVDRNELDEWAAPYLGAAAVFTGVGALIGWAVDAAKSKPHIRFDTPAAGRLTVSLRPSFSRRGGAALAVSIAR